MKNPTSIQAQIFYDGETPATRADTTEGGAPFGTVKIGGATVFVKDPGKARILAKAFKRLANDMEASNEL